MEIDGVWTDVEIRPLLDGVSHSNNRYPKATVRVFYSYSHADEPMQKRIESHLSILRRQGSIKEWYDREITAGGEWAGKIDHNIEQADVILLLISDDFLASDYCYDIELKLAMEPTKPGRPLLFQ